MVYMFLAQGFEEIEALCPLDLMRRAGVDIKTVAVGGGEFVTGSHGISVKADMKDTDFADKTPEMVILPGGMPGTTNLDSSDTVTNAIENALLCDAYICAICAAPLVLGKRGILKGKEAICYPGFEKELEGAIISEDYVVCDDNIITAKGAGVAVEFGLEIAAQLKGRDSSEKIRAAIQMK